MKTIALLFASSLIALSPAATQTLIKVVDKPASEIDAPAAPAVAPNIPLTAPNDIQVTTAPPDANPLASLGTGTPPESLSATTWNNLDDSTRYLTIMGTADGFSSTGAGAPCFVGMDNLGLDAAIKKTGFGDKNPDTIASTLAKLSSGPEKCAAVPKRQYTAALLKSMPDEHLAIYLTGVVRGYATLKPCPSDFQGYAAGLASVAIFSSTDADQPAAIMASALEEGCRGPVTQTPTASGPDVAPSKPTKKAITVKTTRTSK